MKRMLREEEMCGCGEGRLQPMHPCPYTEEIERTHEDECQCCEKCVQRCLEQI